jgi:hypothetical protein
VEVHGGTRFEEVLQGKGGRGWWRRKRRTRRRRRRRGRLLL